MTELLIARVDDVVRGTDGALYRVRRGKTLAEAAHPAVQAAPRAFMPVQIHLPAPDGAPGNQRESAEADVAETTELRADLRAAVEALTAIRDLLANRDLLPPESELAKPGWLVRRLDQILTPVAAPVAPPQPARPAKATPRKAAKLAAGDGA